MLPEGVVKDFFLTSFNLDIGSGLAGNENGVIVIDLKIITLEVWFSFIIELYKRNRTRYFVLYTKIF